MSISEENVRIREKSSIVRYFLKEGLQVSPKALDIIVNLIYQGIEINKIIQFFEERKIKIVTKEKLRDFLLFKEKGNFSEVNKIRKRCHISIVRDFSLCKYKTASIQGFVKYFNSRFKKLRKILEERIDAKRILTIEEIKRNYERRGNLQEVRTISIITEIKTDNKGKNIILTLEDSTGEIKGVLNNNMYLIEKTPPILDSVVLIKGHIVRRDLLKVEGIEFPDIPTNKIIKKSDDDVAAVFISDIHIGSKEFLESPFKNFLKWINQKYGNEDLKNLASKIGFLLIGGDLVDGIGVYPNQDDDLIIKDIFEQYEYAANLLSEIPKDIKIVIIPGNHDPTLQALPQPKIPEEYAKALYKMKNVIMLGNPSLIEINNVRVLMAHGRSLEDIMNAVPNLKVNKPERIMMYLLKVRHLAPIWGGKTPIAPCEDDPLVIEEIPEIFHMGHLHVNGIGKYRNVIIINSGCFQAQTDYQRLSGIDPTPGIVTVVNLKTFQINSIKFS